MAAAGELHRAEVDRCMRIGDHGAELLRAGAQVLTHCNAGALATGGYGTALGVMRSAHRRDPQLHVWVDETRPLFQGARLTAWELEQSGIAATLITDSTAGWLMAQGKVDAVITGADRIARNGDTANKIGTYTAERAGAGPRHAVLRGRAHLDHRPSGARPAPTSRSSIARRPRCSGRHSPADIGVYNPAFDVTPAENISAIITEHGVLRPPFQLAG